MASAISIKGVNKSFGKSTALSGLSLDVPEGSVYAFLGRNGSGKTTTIRILLGLIRADGGQTRVLGCDPYLSPEHVRQKIGFISEERPFYGWMSVDETLRFTASFYREWDWDLVKSLMARLGLAGGSTVNSLSRGMVGKLALIASLGHRPNLLILDEPTAGLDSVVRKQFLEQMIEVVSAGARTVFFSSHLIDEVESIADRVGILHEGKLIHEGTIDEIKETVVRVRALFEQDVDVSDLPESLWDIRQLGREVTFVVSGFSDKLAQELERRGARKVDVLGLTLEEIFVAQTAQEGGSHS